MRDSSGSHDAREAVRPGRRRVGEVRAVPDEVPEEVVRLEAADEDDWLGKWDRSGVGAAAAGAGAEQGGELLDEAAMEELELADVEETWEKKAHHSPMGLIVLAGILGGLVLGVALVRIPKGDRQMEQRASEVAAKLDEEAQSMADAGVLMEHIEQVVQQYLGAGTIEERLQYVRHPERVKPLMEHYYQGHALKARSFGNVSAFYPVGVDNDSFLFMQVRDGDGQVFPLLLEQVGEWEVLVDWETDVAYQPIPMDEFLEKRPAEAVDFRVFAKLDSFYAYEFADSERYQSLLLTERDSDTYLFGYLDRASETYREVMTLLGGDGKRTEPMLLKVRFLPGSRSHRSVLVEEVVARRWALMTPG